MIQRTEQLPYKERLKKMELFRGGNMIKVYKSIKAEYGECRTVAHRIPQYYSKEECDKTILRSA